MQVMLQRARVRHPLNNLGFEGEDGFQKRRAKRKHAFIAQTRKIDEHVSFHQSWLGSHFEGFWKFSTQPE